ncbi:FG-GAP repeat domain-containing protein [Micromonospora sp. NPDC049175]|uniref:FG-GAP repeat domain-containing protein n=1 Tax=Micromonospora sp. NPDC049175 TaxID=3364266 RepID=UPI003720EB54
MRIYAGNCGSFNGDGRRDVLARNPATGELLVYPHSGELAGTDTFGAPVLIRTGMDMYSRWIGAGDFTGNGFADVLVNTGDDQVRVYLNQGGLNGLQTLAEEGIHIGGKLSPDISYDTIALADIFGDGRTDCFGRLQGTNEVHSMINQGLDGMNTFAPPKHIATIGDGEVPFGIADVTGDGHPDLLAEASDDELVLYHLFAEGADDDGEPVGPPRRHVLSRGWAGMLTITLTDLTGDGHPDLLGLAPDGTLYAFAHRGGFDPARPLDTYAEPVVVATGFQGYNMIG